MKGKILNVMVTMLVLTVMLSTVHAEVSPVTGSTDTNINVIEHLDVVESAPAAVNIVDFDDIALPPDTTQQIINYAGITWDSGLPDYWGGNDGGWSVYNSLSYATPFSPPNYAYNSYGAINPGFTFAALVNFNGAYLMTTDAIENVSAVRFVGYVSGVPIYYSGWLTLSSTPAYLNAGFTGVDKVMVEMDGSGWFAMDDLSYDAGTSPIWQTAYNTLFDSSPYLELLRQHRDKVLSKTTKGKMYKTLLYMSSEEALEVLLDNPELMLEAKDLIEANKDAVSEVLNGNEGVIYNTDEIISFLDAYAKESPPDLKILANMVKSDMLRKQSNGKLFLGFELR